MPAIKVVGVQDLSNLQKMVNLGVDYLGFCIDVPSVPYNLSLYTFCNLVQNLDFTTHTPQIVVELENPLKVKIQQIIDTGLANVLQFNGQEDGFLLSEVYFQTEVWKLFKINSSDKIDKIVQKLEKYKHYSRLFNLELDKPFDGNLEDNPFGQISKYGYDLILSGFLNTENIYDNLSALKPEMVEARFNPASPTDLQTFDKLEEFVTICKNWRR